MLSVVIPALGEAGFVGEAVRSAWAAGAGEVIVVDGGSADKTVVEAEAAGARVVTGHRGRAAQMNAGAALARGNVLLFLHADTRLPEGAADAVTAALLAPGALGGCFRLRFDTPGALFAFYEWVTRRDWPWLVFGDRALFVRRAAFEALGGFGSMPVFEDLDLVARLARRRGFRFLDLAVTTSARRFRADGVLRRQLRNAALYVCFQLGVNPERLARAYPYEDRRGG